MLMFCYEKGVNMQEFRSDSHVASEQCNFNYFYKIQFPNTTWILHIQELAFIFFFPNQQ